MNVNFASSASGVIPTLMHSEANLNIEVTRGRSKYVRLAIKALATACPPISPPRRSRRSFLLLCIPILLQSLFLCNLLSLPHFPISPWLQSLFALSRIDAICHTNEERAIFAVVVSALAVVPPIAVLCVLLRPHATTLAGYRYFLCLPSLVLSDVLLIPASFTLLRLAIGEEAAVPTPVSGSLSALSFSVLCVTVVAFRSVHINPCWRATADPYARMESGSLIKELAVTEALVLSFALHSGTQMWALTAVRVALSGYAAWVFLAYQPYYSLWVNILAAGKWVVFLWTLALFQVQALLTGTDFSLVLFLTPLLIVLFLQHRKTLMRCAQYCHGQNQYWTLFTIDLQLRALLQAKEVDHEAVKAVFAYAKKECRESLEVSIWEALYYFLHRDARDLAMLRLSTAPRVKSHFSLTVLRYRLIKELAKARKGRKWEYLSYHQDLEVGKYRDCASCLSFQRFLTSFSKSSAASEIYAHMLALDSTVTAAERWYRGMLKRYPNSRSVERLYGSLLLDVMGDEKGRKYWSREAGESSGVEEAVPQMVVNASHKRCGVIEMVNDCCLTLIGGEKALIEKQQLSKLIPSGFTTRPHDEILREFSLSTETLTFSHGEVFLRTGEQTAKRVRITGSLISTGSTAYYEVTLHNLTPKGQEFALIDSSTCELVLMSKEFFSGLEITPQCGSVKDAVNAAVQGMESQGRKIAITEKPYSCGRFQGLLLTYDHPSPCQVFIGRKSSLSSPKKVTLVSEFVASQDATTTVLVHPSAAKPQFPQFLRTAASQYRKHTLYLWFCQITTTVLITALLYILLNFYFDIFTTLDSVSTINDMGRRRFRTSNVVDCIRELQLISVGVLPKTMEQSVRDSLAGNVSDLKQILERLRSDSVNWPNDEHWDMYVNNVVPVWELMEGNIQGRTVPLFEAMGLMVQHASAVLHLHTVNFTDPDAFYVYRNGLGETMDFLNRSTFLYISSELVLAREMLDSVTATTVLSIHGILAVCVVVAGYFIVALERRNAEAWRQLYRADKRVLQTRCSLLHERLEVFDILEPPPPTPFRPPKKQRIYPQFRLVLLILVLQTAAISGFAFYISLYTKEYVATTLTSKIPYMNMVGIRRWLSVLNYVWLREVYMDGFTNSHYFSAAPMYQAAFSALEKSKEIEEEYSMTERRLLYGGGDSMINSVVISETHFDMLFRDPCPTVTDLRDCGKTLIGRGLHYGLEAYRADLIVVRNLISDGEGSWEEVQKVVEEGRNVGLGFAEVADVYDSDGTAEVQSAMKQMQLSLLAFLLLALVLLSVLVTWAVQFRYRHRLETVLRVGKLMHAADTT